jgi:hypothetical protein
VIADPPLVIAMANEQPDADTLAAALAALVQAINQLNANAIANAPRPLIKDAQVW